MLVVDTSVWIDFFNDTDTREAALLAQRLGQEPVLMLDIILMEVLQGFSRDADYHLALASLEVLDVASVGGRDMALAAAANFRTLRRRGITVRKSVDCLIATYCIRHGHKLLHRDRDFDAFQTHLGLSVL